MRRVVLYVALLAGSLLLLDRAVALVLSNALFPSVLSGEAGGDVNFLLEKKKGADLLILGSSRARHHIDPSALAPEIAREPFNAGANGVGDLFYAGVVLDLALREGLRPHTVLLQTDAWHFAPEALADGPAEERRARSLSALYPFIGRSPLLDRYLRERLDFREKTLLRLRAYRFNGKVPNLLAHRLRPTRVDRNGYEALDGRLNPSVRPAAARPAANAQSAFDPASLGALRDIAEACARHGIRLVVVIPPYFGAYEGGEARRALRRTLRERGADRVVDFGEAPSRLRDAKLWRDPGHLNREGSALFSGMLRDSLAAGPPRDQAPR